MKQWMIQVTVRDSVILVKRQQLLIQIILLFLCTVTWVRFEIIDNEYATEMITCVGQLLCLSQQ